MRIIPYPAGWTPSQWNWLCLLQYLLGDMSWAWPRGRWPYCCFISPVPWSLQSLLIVLGFSANGVGDNLCIARLFIECCVSCLECLCDVGSLLRIYIDPKSKTCCFYKDRCSNFTALLTTLLDFSKHLSATLSIAHTAIFSTNDSSLIVTACPLHDIL